MIFPNHANDGCLLTSHRCPDGFPSMAFSSIQFPMQMTVEIVDLDLEPRKCNYVQYNLITSHDISC